MDPLPGEEPDLRPSPAEELTVLGRVLGDLTRYEGLTAEVAEDLQDAVRSFRRTEKSLRGLVPYLVSDNERMRVLLRSFSEGGADLDEEERAAIDTVPDAMSGDWLEDVDQLNRCNESLRAILSHLLSGSGLLPHGKGAADIADALRASVDARPW